MSIIAFGRFPIKLTTGNLISVWFFFSLSSRSYHSFVYDSVSLDRMILFIRHVRVKFKIELKRSGIQVKKLRERMEELKRTYQKRIRQVYCTKKTPKRKCYRTKVKLTMIIRTDFRA